MNIQSTPPSYESGNLEIRNTGLRPNWDSFWAVEMGGLDQSSGSGNSSKYRFQPSSMFSFKSAQSGGGTSGIIRHVRLITGSEWIGEWDRTGMTGMGMYKMPHGVIYEGTMKAGLFEGIGVLKYPNGSFLEGLWYQGKLKYWQYDYADGLERDCQHWRYCTMPDRRFYSEHVNGFRPATTEQMTNEYPAREIPPGHYDVGQGFYNPKSHCVVDVVSGEVLSIPTADEERWIMEKCRYAEPIETVGYRPDLYENWFKKAPQQSKYQDVKYEDSEQEIAYQDFTEGYSQVVECEHWVNTGWEEVKSVDKHVNAEQEILSLIQQEGAKLQTIDAMKTHYEKVSFHEKLESNLVGDSDPDQPRITEVEGLLKKIMKEIENQKFKHSLKTSDDSDQKGDYDSNESSVMMLTQLINIYGETTYRKKTVSSESSFGALEQFKIIGKLLPSMSLYASKIFPFQFGTEESSTEAEYDHSFQSMCEPYLFKVLQVAESRVLKSTIYEANEQNL